MTKEEFEMWKYSPAGRWFFEKVLHEQVKELTIALANGSCRNDDPNKIAMHYMDQIGVIAGIEFVRNLDPFGEENAIESDRETPSY